MSYPEFPPPLSSSPPPLDAFPPMPDEDEEDFGQRRDSQSSPTFDITGLSEKLPPTPKDSPAKQPLTHQEPVSSPQSVHDSLHFSLNAGPPADVSPAHWLPNNRHSNEEPLSDGPLSDRLASDCSSSSRPFTDEPLRDSPANSGPPAVVGDPTVTTVPQYVDQNDMDFGDFSDFNTEFKDKKDSHSEMHKENLVAEFDKSSFEVANIKSTLNFDNSSGDVCSNKAVTEDESSRRIEDEEDDDDDDDILAGSFQHRQIVNDRHYTTQDPDIDEDNFSEFEAPSDETSIVITDILNADDKSAPPIISDSVDLLNKLSGTTDNVSTNNSEFSTITPQDASITESKDIAFEPDFGNFAAFETEMVQSIPFSSNAEENCEDHGSQTLYLNKVIVNEKVEVTEHGEEQIMNEKVTIPGDLPLCQDDKETNFDTSESFTDFEAFADFESAPEQVPFTPAFEATFESQHMADSHCLAEQHSSLLPQASVLADDVVMSCSLPTIEGLTDVSPDDDDDFGYRDIDTGGEGEDTDDDSSRGNTKSKREEGDVMVEATNKLVRRADSPDNDKDEDRAGCSDHQEQKAQSEEEDDDDFDDFVTSTNCPSSDNNAVEFDEFASAKIDDAFGEFASETPVEGGGASEEDDDEFGEFGGAGEGGAEGRKCSLTGFMRGTSVESGAGRLEDQEEVTDPLLKRLSSLVRKWVSLEGRGAESSSTAALSAATPPLLRDVVAGDAFVWRKLECVEWRNVAWQSSVAHQLMLRAINMDARNILYSQKWSSSVPLFAQSLSFSPLTPAKSSSNSSGNVLHPTAAPPAAVLTPTSLAAEGDSCSVVEGGGLLSAAAAAPEGTGHVPEVSSSLGPPAGAASSDAKGTVNITHMKDFEAVADAPEARSGGGGSSSSSSIPPAQFDWLSSGLTNPLDLAAQSAADGKKTAGGSSSSGAQPPLPTALQQLLAQSSSSRPAMTSLEQLTEQQRRFLQSLPDISFMTARVLMFPIGGETD